MIWATHNKGPRPIGKYCNTSINRSRTRNQPKGEEEEAEKNIMYYSFRTWQKKFAAAGFEQIADDEEEE